MSKRYRKSFGIQRAVTALLKIIEDQVASGYYFLPSITELTKQIGVSYVTVQRALKILEKQGVLLIVPKRSIQIIDVSPPNFINKDLTNLTEPDSVFGDSVPRWKELKIRLSERLNDFFYPPGSTLPSLKELCSRYGTSYRVLIKSLQALVDDGKLERFQSGYRVCKIRRGIPQNTIVFFQEFNDMTSIQSASPHAEKYWRYLEDECRRLHIHLHICTIPQSSRKEPFHIIVDTFIEKIESEHIVLGYIVSTICSTPQLIPSLLQSLRSLHKPVAVLDEFGIAPDKVSRNCPHAHLFPVGTTSMPGEIMGRYLLESGCRSVVYLSSGTHRYRFDGLEEIFVKAGLKNNIHFLAQSSSDRTESSILESKQFVALKRLLKKDLTPFVNQYGIESVRDPYIHRSAKFFTQLQFRSFFYRDLFLQALDHKQCTAWVAFNDYIALAALDFLTDQGIDVPGEISVVGFDDTIEAFGRGLTSYNFNIPAVFNAILEYLLSPPRFKNRNTFKVVEIPGKIMERKTVKALL